MSISSTNKKRNGFFRSFSFTSSLSGRCGRLGGYRRLLNLVHLIARSTAITHGDSLLRALRSTQTTARAGAKHLVLLLQFTLDSVKLTLLRANRASDAEIRIDVGFLAVFEFGLHCTGRTGVSTSHTTNTLFVIDLRYAVHHLDGAKVTGLDAGLTADTSAITLLLEGHTLFRIVAADGNDTVLRLHAQHMLRASGDALLTALALLFVNHGDLLDGINRNGAKRTSAFTGTKTKAGVLAGLRARIHKRSGHAVMDALILSLGRAVLAVALTGDGGNHTDTSRGLNTHDLAHFLSASRAADSTGAYLSTAVSNSGCVTVTARIAASAAVSARQAFTKSVDRGVGRNRKYTAGNTQKCTENQAKRTHNQRSVKNSSNTHFYILLAYAVKSDR